MYRSIKNSDDATQNCVYSSVPEIQWSIQCLVQDQIEIRQNKFKRQFVIKATLQKIDPFQEISIQKWALHWMPNCCNRQLMTPHFLLFLLSTSKMVIKVIRFSSFFRIIANKDLNIEGMGKQKMERKCYLCPYPATETCSRWFVTLPSTQQTPLY